jgi:exoribonuclease-2
MKDIIVQAGAVQPKIAVIQRKWSRYWMLKYIEQEDIQTLDALVLDSGDRFAHLLLPEFLIETNVLLTDKTRVPPGEMIRVKVDRVNPREDVIRVLLPDFFKQG